MRLCHNGSRYKTLRLKSCDSSLKLLYSATLSIAFLCCGWSYAQTAGVKTALVQAASPQNIWRGVDISYINELEDCGAVYRANGEIRDPFEILADKGANLARFRLWHNPDWTEYSTLPDVMKSIRRAKDNGMRVLLDFHYSDDWADPQNQRIPAAWRHAGSVEEVAKLLYDYTFTTLMTLHEQDLLPDYVQVGNEINSGIARVDPQFDAWWENPERNTRLLNAGIMAVRDVGAQVDQPLEVMLHLSKPEEVEHWLDTAKREGLADFDIIGVSYYAQWSEVPLNRVANSIQRLRSKYGKEVVIAETAYPWTLINNDRANNILSEAGVVEGYSATQAGQRRYLIDLLQAVVNGGGLGIIYWEPAWISTGCATRWGVGSHWENGALFDYENSELHGGADFLSYEYSIEPPVQTELTVTAASETEISLSWTAPEGVSVGGYNVLRCEEGDMTCTPGWLAWVTNGNGDPPPAPTEFTDTNVTQGTTYHYVVEGKVGDDYDAIPWSNQVTAVAETQTPAVMPDIGTGQGDGDTKAEEDSMSPSPDIGGTFIQKHHQVKKAIDDFEDAPGGTTWAEAMNADSDDEEVVPHVLSFRSRADEAALGGTFIDQYQYLTKGDRDYVRDSGGTTWTGTAWQGDRVHAPLVVWANDSAWQGTLDYEMSDLTGGYGQVISKDQVRILYPTYVTADPERRGCDGYATRNGVEPVYLADALSTTPAPVALPAEPFKVWLVIDVPEDAGPGSYSGLFVVRDPALEDTEVIFTVNMVVQNHRLPAPAEWQFELNLWQHPEWVLRHYNAAHPEARIKRWSAGHYDLLEGSYRLLGDAGQKWVTTTLKDGALGALGMVSWTRTREEGNDWRFDFTAFGAHVETLMGWGIGPRIEAFGILGWNRDEIPYWSEQRRVMRTLAAPVGSAAHRAAWQAFLPAFRTYLEDKGWFAQTWLSIDESDAALLGPLVDLVRADDPAWNIAISYFDTDLPADVLALAAATNIYLGIAGEAGLPNTAETIRTLYTSCADGSRVNSFVTPDSNPAEVEWLTWYAGKLDRDGYSRWAYDYWRAAEPLDMRQLSFTSGDTALMYRTSNDRDLEAMTSIRLTLLRYGIQQYEKRRILRELYGRCEYPTGLALLDELVSDNFISLESAGNGAAGTDLVRAHEQLDIVSADAQAIADGCN